jgi:hypothetical protein
MQLGGEQPTNEQVEAERARVATRLKAAWRLPWDNRLKETWWRLLLDGVQGAGGHGIALSKPCPCGWDAPAHLSKSERAAAQRAHVFWGCTPAVAIRTAISHNLSPGSQLLPKHLWLLQPPGEQVEQGVWAVAGMAALSAMAGARKCMWALHMEDQRGAARGRARPAAQVVEAVGASSDEASDDDLEPARRQRQARRAANAQQHRRQMRQQRRGAPAPSTTPHQYAARRAVAQFEAGVRKFVDLGQVPDSWGGKVQEGHCFIGVRSRADPADENNMIKELVFNMRRMGGDVLGDGGV